MSRKHRTKTARPDIAPLLEGISSTEESIRAKAVGRLCPCRIGFEAFEPHLNVVREMCKDPSPAVRKAALHIAEEVGQLKSGGLATNPREVLDEMLATKRRMRPRREEDDIEERKRRDRKPRYQPPAHRSRQG